MRDQISLHELYRRVSDTYRELRCRYGQAFLVELRLVRPDLHEGLAQTDMDPFYMYGPSTHTKGWDKFIHFIESNWYSLPKE